MPLVPALPAAAPPPSRLHPPPPHTHSKPAARVVPKASLNDAPKMFKETGAEAPLPTASLNFTTTPFDNYKFAPIREATVSADQLTAGMLVVKTLALVLFGMLPAGSGVCAAAPGHLPAAVLKVLLHRRHPPCLETDTHTPSSSCCSSNPKP